MAQLMTIGTSSLAIILTEDQPVGQAYGNQCSLKHPPQPHEPEASVAM